MTKRQKVSFIVTTGDDEVLDNMAVEPGIRSVRAYRDR
jgi:hypothetical protein